MPKHPSQHCKNMACVTTDSLRASVAPADNPDNAGGEGQAAALLLWAVIAGFFTLCSYFLPVLETPPLYQVRMCAGRCAVSHRIQNIGLSVLVTYGWTLSLDPLLFGGGMLTGPRVGVSLLIGAILAWGIVGPFVREGAAAL